METVALSKESNHKSPTAHIDMQIKIKKLFFHFAPLNAPSLYGCFGEHGELVIIKNIV